MKVIMTRRSTEEECQQAIAWANVEAPAANRAAATVYCAHNGKPRAYATAIPVICLEDFAPAPDATDVERASALWSIIQAIGAIARDKGLDEIIFFGGQKGLAELAVRHGFEKIELPMYSLKLR